METKKQKIDKKAATGTILSILLLLLILLIFKLSVPLPLPEEEGIIIDMGMAGGGGGGMQSSKASDVSSPSDQKATTQTTDANPQKTSKIATFEDAEAPKMAKTEEVVKEEKPTPNPFADFGNWKKNRTDDSKGQGTGTGDGTGSGTGPGAGSGTGGGTGSGSGPGAGPHYDLSGRGSKHLPKPDYNINEEGKVVVDIWVDRDGKVIRAVPGARGTTTTNTHLHNKAKEAAERASFTSKPDAPEIQKGSITYYFILQ